MASDWGLYHEYELSQERKTLFLYKGAISQEILAEIAESLKSQVQGSPLMVHKFFAIFIELAQNIRHHSHERVFVKKEGKDVGVGILRASTYEDYYLLVSGNYITHQASQRLLERSAYINQLDKDGLRDYYREQRKKPKVANQKGANVGLIDMVRRSGNPIEAVIEHTTADQVFISVAVRIDRDPIHSSADKKL
ncbi:MAG: SiaB family protein kinase [Bernardetiaceae bacterium]